MTNLFVNRVNLWSLIETFKYKSVLGAVRTESPIVNESNPAMDEVNEDRESRKGDVQTTMDFAANIEKVKEVTRPFLLFTVKIIDLIEFCYCLFFSIVWLVLGPDI